MVEITPIPICLFIFIRREPDAPLLSLTPQGMGDAREAPMEDQQYFLQQANRCFQIGRTCLDLAAARKINELGNEFLNKAAKSERRDARFPPGASDRDFAA